MRWLAKRAARKRAQRVGSEVIAIIREVIDAVSDAAEIRSEIGRRVQASNFLSTKGLIEIRAMDEREAEWLKGLK